MTSERKPLRVNGSNETGKVTNAHAGRAWLALFLGIGVLCVVSASLVTWYAPARSLAASLAIDAYRARYAVLPVKGQARLAALHADTHALPNQACEACHSDMRGSSMALHGIHLTSSLLPGLACHDCHRSVNLRSRGDTTVVSWVDEGVCKSCHSPFPGLSAASKMKPTDYRADCLTCHNGRRAPVRHAAYVARVSTAQACRTCHGALALPWTPLHERSDWVQTHGAQALRVGTSSCLECHDFGLKFCDSCHSIRPPSHSPRDQWLVEHPARAQADTRACFTCHKPTFCKQCHVNHEANWLADHSAFVKAHGTSSCTQCHSLTVCAYCHAGNPVERSASMLVTDSAPVSATQ